MHPLVLETDIALASTPKLSIKQGNDRARNLGNPTGPILVEGEIDFIDKFGHRIAKDKRMKIDVLYGCGRSLSEPFRDESDSAPGKTGDEND